MDMFVVTAEYDGRRVNVRVVTHFDAYHGSLMPRNVVIRRASGVSLDACLESPFQAALVAEAAAMAELTRRVSTWASDTCGCQRHSFGGDEAMFDLYDSVRASLPQ